MNTSRRGIDLEDTLPAAGASVRRRGAWYQAEATVAFSRDEAILASAGDEIVERFDAWNGLIRVAAQPRDDVAVGGQLAFAERASWELGPTWSEVELDVQTVDLWDAVLYADWRITRHLRLGYDLLTQRAGVFRAGFRTAPSDPTDDELTFTASPVDEPRFTDHRLRAAWRALDRGWLRLEGRHRTRPEREEVRVVVSVDADRLWPDGLFARGRVSYDDVDPRAGRGTPFDVDRRFWLGAIGYRLDRVEIEIGASRLERLSGPVSGRRFDLERPGEPGTVEDLHPFTLEQQGIAFVRAFYERGGWFTGFDVERNLEDADEVRFFLQLGAHLGTEW